MPELPLLDRDQRSAIRAVLRRSEHPAVLLYRFLDGRKPPDRDNQEAFDNIWKLFGQRATAILSTDRYRSLFAALDGRQAAIVDTLKALGWETYCAEFQTASRLAPGLSNGRIWSISFLLHPVWGVPYIPATSIKGALRRRAADLGHDVNSVFGDELNEGEPPEDPGHSCVMVFDAFPALPPTPRKFLVEDVLNKHYEEYYENDQPGAPTDYCAPTPVKFLTVARSVTFRFRLAVVPGEEQQKVRENVRGWLNDCLQRQGVGAKARAGYGRFRLIRELT